MRPLISFGLAPPPPPRASDARHATPPFPSSSVLRLPGCAHPPLHPPLPPPSPRGRGWTRTPSFPCAVRHPRSSSSAASLSAAAAAATSCIYLPTYRYRHGPCAPRYAPRSESPTHPLQLTDGMMSETTFPQPQHRSRARASSDFRTGNMPFLSCLIHSSLARTLPRPALYILDTRLFSSRALAAELTD